MSQRHWFSVPDVLEGETGLSVSAVLSIVTEKLTVSKAHRGGIVYGRLSIRATGVISGEQIGDGTIEVVNSVSCTAGSGIVVVVVAVCLRT